MVTTMSVLALVSSGFMLALKVQAAQRIVDEPQDVRILQGETATLRCRVEDQQGPLQWTKDDFGLGTDRTLASFPRYSMVGSSADGEYHLQVENVSLEDDAKYRCQIGSTETQRGVVSDPAHLVVLVRPQPPVIVNMEDAINTVEDRAFTVTCAVDGGKPAPTVTWVVAANSDGTGIIRKFTNPADGKDPIITEASDPHPDARGVVNFRSNLRFSPRRDDDGKFLVCIANHETVEKGAMAAAASLDVQYSPRVTVSLDPEETPKAALKESDPATLLCSADAKPADGLRYAWKRDGSQLQHEHGRRLRIAALQPFHNGAVFECEVTNTVGTRRGTFTTKLSYGPRMPTGERVAVDVGDSVTLSCPADGNPQPLISWTKTGAPQTILAMGANYTISSLKAWQAGNYECSAEVPGFPVAKASYTIHINGPPRVMMSPVVEGGEGDAVEIICDVQGFPFPTSIDWRKAGRRLDMKEHPTYELRQLPQAEGVVSILTIREATPEDFDEFNCSATNPLGTHSATTRLLIANPFPLYIMIPCLIGGFVLLAILILCLVLCSRRSCSGKSSHRSGDSHSDVTMKVEDVTGLPMNGGYYGSETYGPPPSLHDDSYGKDYLPIPQDNPDLDQLPPPYPYANGYQNFGNNGPPSTSTFRDPGNSRLVHVTYVDDRQLIDGKEATGSADGKVDENRNREAASPILCIDEYGNIVGSDYGERYGGHQYWHPAPSASYADPNAVYYPSHMPNVHGGLEPVAELPTPASELGSRSGLFRPSPLPDQSSPTTQTSGAGSSGPSSTTGPEHPPTTQSTHV